jgi:hypothetical protein
MSTYLFGQLSDPNISALIPYFDKFIDQNSEFHWDLQTDKLHVNGHEIDDIEAIFMRANVFEDNTHQKQANYFLMRNYISYFDHIKIFNRHCHRETPYKLYNLKLAMDIGLNIPYTEATRYGRQEGDTILKPITGGMHTEVGKVAVFTTTVQQQIKGKNKRLYTIGDKQFGFEVVTDKIDYRDDTKSDVVVSDIPEDEALKVKELMKKLNLNFSAADFMVDENDKHWFLEVNTLPMFAAFDLKVNGDISKTLHDELMKL